jgi:phosphocarrier protein
VRPATHFAETASKYRSRIWVIKEPGPGINAKSSIDLLMLAAVAGTRLTVRAEGDDAQEAVDVLTRMIESKFGEE